MALTQNPDLLRDLDWTTEFDNQPSPFWQAIVKPATYPRYDERGCWRGRPRTWFECMTPLGRVRAIKYRIRTGREQQPITIRYREFRFVARWRRLEVTVS